MVSNGESVRLVPDSLQQEKRVRVALQDDRIALARQKYPLLQPLNFSAPGRRLDAHFGQADGFHAGHTDFRHRS